MQGGVKQKLLFSWYIRAIWRGRPVGPAGRPATLGRGRGRSVGLVVLERLREPRLDLANAGRVRRVSREEFRLSGTLLLAHTHPQIASGARVVSRLRHQDEPEMIGFRLLLAAPRQEHADRCPRSQKRAYGLDRRGIASRESGHGRLQPDVHEQLLA